MMVFVNTRKQERHGIHATPEDHRNPYFNGLCTIHFVTSAVQRSTRKALYLQLAAIQDARPPLPTQINDGT